MKIIIKFGLRSESKLIFPSGYDIVIYLTIFCILKRFTYLDSNEFDVLVVVLNGKLNCSVKRT